jgi:RHS repeat-associated protein
MLVPLRLLFLLSTLGCVEFNVDPDLDGDGVRASEDCDDNEAQAYPGAEEVCDGVDNDCDGEIDGPLATGARDWAQDLDGDTFGDASASVTECTAPEGYVQDINDCDDGDATINPLVDELYYDGVDQDCNGLSDYDADLDGEDSAEFGGPDCDDADRLIHTAAEEIYYDGVDQNCDGLSDYDADQDGQDSIDFEGDDCDDTNLLINTLAAEIYYDGIDQNCDGASDYDADQDGELSLDFGGVDCDDADPAVMTTATEIYYDGVDQNCDGFSDYDADLDGEDWDAHGGQDCDDTNSSILSTATEIYYDGVDQNCDGASDYDGDADGQDSTRYGGLDCDDTDSAILTTAAEIYYDGVDQNCDALSDYDADLDGEDGESYGGTDCDDTDSSVLSTATEIYYDGVDQDCDDSSDYDSDVDGEDSDVYGGTDCDDTDSAILSTATEIYYDGVDQNCDALSDYDSDQDGEDWDSYGGADCDDTDSAILSTATEIYYDGVDQDCDGASDYDADLDGEDLDTYGGLDCDDTDSTVLSTATETYYDGVDQDCDGLSDYDIDLDGYDSDAYGGADCDDADSSISPDAVEVAHDSVDQNCDGFDGPEVSLSSTTGILAALQGYDALDPADVVVMNSGEGALSWTASADQTWVSLSATSGSDDEVLSIGSDATSLSVGTHTANITVTDTLSGGASQVFALTVEVAETWSGTTNTTLTYTDSGRLDTRTDGEGEVLTMDYDTTGRLVELSAASGEVLTLDYDAGGMLDTYESDYGVLSLSYSAEELQTATYPSGDAITYTWDSSGRITKRVLPSGAIISTTYDTSHPLLASKIVHSKMGATSFTYDNDARISTRTQPNGTVSTWTYEATFGKADTLTQEDGSGNILLEQVFSYDDMGRIETLERTESTGTTETVTYGYDDIGRLESETYNDGTTRAWVYDTAGNRSTLSEDGEDQDTLVDSADRLLAQGDAVFEYDQAGRMTKRLSPQGETSYSWDAFGRLISVTTDTETVDYEYGANDLLLERSDSDADILFFYDMNGPLPRLLQTEIDTGGTITEGHYLWAGGLSSIEYDGTDYDVLGDHTGTVHGLYDGTNSHDFAYHDAFGALDSTPGLSEPLESSTFNSAYTDPDTGLVYMWHRWYDPAIGRFISPDLVSADSESPATLNVYVYVQNDPVNFYDPTGLFLEGANWGMVGSGIATLAGGVITLAVIAVAGPAIGAGAAVVGFIALTNVAFGLGTTVVGLAGGPAEGTTMPGSLVDLAAIIAKAQTDNPETHLYIDGAAQIADILMPGIDTKKIDVARLSQKMKDLLSRFNDLTTAQKALKANELNEQMEQLLREAVDQQDSSDIPADDVRGGIYINANATVLGDLSQINGAGVDPNTGQLVFYGEDGGATPAGVDGDMLYTALQWMGDGVADGGFTAPGVTIENDLVPTEEPSPPDSTNTYHGVGYFGGIEYTEMGFAAFEADRIMKGLSMGVDNEDTSITYDATSLSVPSFDTHIGFYESYYDGTSPSGWVRMWIEPDVMELTEDATRDAFEFTESTMLVQYEDQDDTTLVWDDYADFTDMLTTYYDDIALEIESWEDLRTASQCIAMAYWLYQNDLYKDLAWDQINAYEVEVYDTPWWTLEGSVTSSFEYGGSTISTTHRGGANTTTFGEVYSADTSGDVEAYWDEVEAARSSDLDDSWTYTSPDGNTGVAVALTGKRVPMAGSVLLSDLDLFAPVAGEVPLNLVRSYSSALGVDAVDMGMGAGWNYTPYGTRVSELSKVNGSYSAPTAVEVFDHMSGRTHSFKLDGWTGSDAVYSSPNRPNDSLESDISGILTWLDADSTEVVFDADGLLTSVTSIEGDSVDYSWSSAQLTDITHSDGDSISLTWDGSGYLSSASTTTGWTVSYGYDADGMLDEVTDMGSGTWDLSYSSDGLLNQIAASDGAVLFEATYDDMGRALTKAWGGVEKSYTPDLLTRSLTVTDSAGVEWLLYLDEDGKYTHLEDGEGGLWERAYNSDGLLESVTDPDGNMTSYSYDSADNLYTTEDDEGNTWKKWWSWTGDRYVMVAYEQPDGGQFYLSHDTDGNPDTLYSATLTTSGSTLTSASLSTTLESWTWESGLLDTWERGDLSLDVDYDSYGQPTTTTDLFGRETSFTYDATGRLTESETAEGVAVTYTWDSTHPTSVASIAIGGTTVVSYSYDSLGRLTQVEDGLGAQTTYSYGSSVGTLSGVSTEDGGSWTYTQDGAGRTTKIVGGSGFQMDRSYDNAGRISDMELTVSLP